MTEHGHMQATPYANINEILELLLASLQSILGAKLVGLYLNGSLVIGDFDPEISDIDLVAALSSDIDVREFEALQKMHTAFAQQHRAWDGRIEVCYISVAALNTVRSRTSNIANISPGEPFHRMKSSSQLQKKNFCRPSKRTPERGASGYMTSRVVGHLKPMPF